MNSDRSVYLPGLNGIRAIAAMVVIFSHIDQFSYLFGLDQVGIESKGLAGYGVTMFFTLSGFLITFLLLREQEKTGKIDFPKFYIRRILRIWPIYYLIIAVAAILILCTNVLPEVKADLPRIFYYVFFLANFLPFSAGISTIMPLWSVAVEEQFYAFWPLVVSSRKYLPHIMIGIIVLVFGLKIFASLFLEKGTYSVLYRSAFNIMAIGGLGAYLLNKQHAILKIVFHPATQIVGWLFLFYSVIIRAVHIVSLFDTEIYSLIFMIVILNVSSNPKTLIRLENKVFNFLGKISYGMYVYHMTLIYLLSYLAKKMKDSYGYNINNFTVYLAVLILTVILSGLSYTYFEQYFLRRKIKFMVVRSSNQG